MDFKIPAQRLGLEVEEYLELIQLFLETGTNDLNGLEDAKTTNNMKAVIERSHSLKGASGNLGITGIFEKARDIENKARNNSLEGIDNAVMEIRKYFNEIVRSLGEKI